MCGCCIEDALTEATRYFDAAWSIGEDVAESALQKISWNINTSGGIKGSPSGKEDWILWESDGQGAPIVVFNPHSFPVKQLVQVNHGGIISMTDENGSPIVIDHTRGQQSNGADIYNTLFMADVPAYGYRTYYAYTKKELDAPKSGALSVTETCLENDFLKVEFDRSTGAFSLYDKKQKMMLINAGGLPLVMDDTQSDTWAHMIFSFNDQIGRFSDPTFEVVNHGPLRATIRVTSSYNRSVLRQDFTLDCFSTKLSVKCRLDFHEQRKVVKLSFPVAGDCKEILYEMPFGFIKKECNGQEEPGHRYVSMSGVMADGRHGSVALLNDGKYSFSAQNNTMYMMIARGCGYADHFWYHNSPIDYMDQGRQEFCYELLPHTGEGLAGVTKSAMLLNQPLEHIMETNHDGTLERTYSGISISAENIVCETIKYAESEDALVLRLYETAGETVSTDVALQLPSYETSFTLHFGKHEIKTIMVFPDNTIKEVNLIEL